MSKYKVGDILRAEGGSVEARITTVTPAGNYILLFGDAEVLRDEDYVDSRYVKVEPFFEEGKTYSNPASGNPTHRIDKVYDLSGTKYAVGVGRFDSGETWLTVLGQRDFNWMKEVDLDR